jgi:hypothetical protein
MWIVIPLVIGSVVLVVAGFTWAARREALARARLVQHARLAPLDGVREGELAAVSAAAVRAEPLVDPVTGQNVAWYEARLARTDGPEKILRAARDGDLLTLEDPAGRVEVSLEGAELGVPWDEPEESEAEPSARMRSFLSAAELPIPERDASARYVLSHRAIALGEPITVLGKPRSGERGSTRAGYRGGAAFVPRFDARSDPFIVTRSTLAELKDREGADVRAMSRMLRFATGLGVVLVAISLLLLALA